MPGDNVSNRVSVRDTTDDDLAAIQAIYAHHVNYGLASFEETPPDVAEIAHRRDVARDNDLPCLTSAPLGQVEVIA